MFSVLKCVVAVFSLSFVLLTSVGCANTPSVESQLRWYTQLPELNPPGPNRRTVAMTYRDVTGNSPIDLRPLVKESIVRQGYTFEPDPEKADYLLRVTLRHYGLNDKADKGAATYARYGPSNPNDVTVRFDMTGVPSNPAPAPDLSWRGLASGFNQPKKLVEYNLLVDVVLAEKIDGGVNQTVEGTRTDGTAHGVQGQGQLGQTTQVTKVKTTSGQILTHQNYPTMFLVYAQKLGLTEPEARVEIERLTRNALGNTLPSVN